MRVSRDKHIAVELPLDRSEGLHVAPRNHLMAVDYAKLDVSNSDHLGLGHVGQLVEISLHDVGL